MKSGKEAGILCCHLFHVHATVITPLASELSSYDRSMGGGMCQCQRCVPGLPAQRLAQPAQSMSSTFVVGSDQSLPPF